MNDALGVLLNRGLTLTQARSDLQDRAAHGRTGLPGAARTLLDGFPTRHGSRALRLLRSIAPVVPFRNRPSALARDARAQVLGDGPQEPGAGP